MKSNELVKFPAHMINVQLSYTLRGIVFCSLFFGWDGSHFFPLNENRIDQNGQGEWNLPFLVGWISLFPDCWALMSPALRIRTMTLTLDLFVSRSLLNSLFGIDFNILMDFWSSSPDNLLIGLTLLCGSHSSLKYICTLLSPLGLHRSWKVVLT